MMALMQYFANDYHYENRVSVLDNLCTIYTYSIIHKCALNS